jgi:SAM-dependent methyltransferase
VHRKNDKDGQEVGVPSKREIVIIKMNRSNSNFMIEIGAGGKGEMEMPPSGNENKKGSNKKDLHFPNIGFDNLIRKLYEPPQKFNAYVVPGQVVADLGCGPGYFTIPLAECVGPAGRVYAVDSNPNAIRALEKKILKRGLRNIEAHTCTVADLSFIPDRSVDFELANGLLCCVAPDDRQSAVNEMKRVLNPEGKAYLIAGRGYPSYMTDEAWEQILAGFAVEERNNFPYKGDYYALVALMK